MSDSIPGPVIAQIIIPGKIYVENEWLFNSLLKAMVGTTRGAKPTSQLLDLQIAIIIGIIPKPLYPR